MKKAKRGFPFLGVLLVVLLFVGTSAFAGLNDELIEAAKDGNLKKGFLKSNCYTSFLFVCS